MKTNEKPPVTQILLPILIFAALGMGLWFAFPDLRASSGGHAQENNPPITTSDTSGINLEKEPESISAIPPLETEPPRDDKQQPAALSSYPLADHSWGDTFNPQKSTPSQGYFAWYINTNQPKQVIGREMVNSIAINYPFDQFLKIPSEDFGAYWAGRLHRLAKAASHFLECCQKQITESMPLQTTIVKTIIKQIAHPRAIAQRY